MQGTPFQRIAPAELPGWGRQERQYLFLLCDCLQGAGPRGAKIGVSPSWATPPTHLREATITTPAPSVWPEMAAGQCKNVHLTATPAAAELLPRHYTTSCRSAAASNSYTPRMSSRATMRRTAATEQMRARKLLTATDSLMTASNRPPPPSRGRSGWKFPSIRWASGRRSC